MRKSLLAAGAVAASVTLAACGSSSTVTTIKQYVGSFGSQQFVQVHLTSSFKGAGSSQAQAVLKELSVTIQAENPSGGSLSAANGNANAEILVNLGTTTLADVRVVDSNLYFKLDLTGLSSIPGTHLSASEIEMAQLVFGGKWFEVPKSLLEAIVPPPSVAQQHQQTSAARAVEAKLLDALAAYIDSSSYKKTSTGFTESGTLTQLEQAFAPTIASIEHKAVPVHHVVGTYTFSLGTSGSTVTGVVVSVTAPNGTQGNATGTLTATVTHDAISITAPTGATTITPQILSQLHLGG